MKNIIIFSDGTGQIGGKGVSTNVYKLFNMVENRTSKQIAFYDSGIGTRWWDKLSLITGRGLSKNVVDCYQFIFENYQAGDQIYLFGFSRGAATVRSLSAFIHMFGILPQSRDDLIKPAFKIYETRDATKRIKNGKEFIENHHTMWARIKFIGVWDTVAALGVPIPVLDIFIDKIPFSKHRFHNYSLSESVEHARHALAIDETRKSFKPIIWDSNLKKDYQSLKQVWFSGVHSDIGGSYVEQGLSDIAMQWMIDEATHHNLLIYKNNNVAVNPDCLGKLHDFKDGINSLLPKAQRQWSHKTFGTPDVHKSVIERSKKSPGYKPWIIDTKHNVVG